MNMGEVEKTTGEGRRERETILSKHNVNLVQVLHKSKTCTFNLPFPAGGGNQLHMMWMFQESHWLSLYFNGHALNMNLNILLLLLPLDGQRREGGGDWVCFQLNDIRLYPFSVLLCSEGTGAGVADTRW